MKKSQYLKEVLALLDGVQKLKERCEGLSMDMPSTSEVWEERASVVEEVRSGFDDIESMLTELLDE
ncbi:hypothetical protein LLE49_19895 [Alicyclobacillus tolerans]|uniref:hypothetical protein n=1 Tax=Alicyclobacillus tolerans TaxID=90970 RepID=UPI001F30AE9F|nr:hypothetical protein [Alicyclobacillus tolerans]MCF8566987.1 hypothetical protein [Alicyclobacillus tolerans]